MRVPAAHEPCRPITRPLRRNTRPCLQVRIHGLVRIVSPDSSPTS
jgi:hypothetical protein